MPEHWLTFENGKWRNATDDAAPCTRFSDVRGYYSNQIDYARVALCLAAAVTLAMRMPLATALLILVSTLLDWVDGPVARAHNQCTVFGSGVDWLADMAAQIVTLVWLGSVAPGWMPLLAAATTIELANCIFDFATTATGRYPVLDRRGGFGVILDWCMPGGSYTVLGTGLWLAYPVFLLICCLDLSWPQRAELTGTVLRGGEIALAVPAVLYVWCELAYLAFVLERWREAPRKAAAVSFDDGPAGVRYLGTVPPVQQELLQRASDQTRRAMQREWNASLQGKAVFWVNLWQRSGSGEKLPIDCIEEVDRWARSLLPLHYDPSAVELDGYGLIVNPTGSTAQDWHIDYTLDYSTVFVSLTEVSAENALQYAVLPRSIPVEAYEKATANLDTVDLRALVLAGEWVSVRQLLAKPFSMIKMDFGTIHRGVANTSGYDRVLFWVSFIKHGALLPPEPLVQTIPQYGEGEETQR